MNLYFLLHNAAVKICELGRILIFWIGLPRNLLSIRFFPVLTQVSAPEVVASVMLPTFMTYNLFMPSLTCESKAPVPELFTVTILILHLLFIVHCQPQLPNHPSPPALSIPAVFPHIPAIMEDPGMSHFALHLPPSLSC